jgi:RNA polymerase sigma factor (sigma-70 family)
MTPTELLDLSTRIASGIAGRHQDIEDLAQKGVLAMLQARPFDGRGSEEKYLGWRARNGMIDTIRVQPGLSRGQRVPPVTFVGLDAAAELSDRSSPHDVVCETEQAARIQRAIDLLPAREAEAVRLRFFADECQAQVARILGLSPARVSQLMAQARRRLREALREEDS